MKKVTFENIGAIEEISKMLFLMYNEVQPEKASQDLDKYTTLANKHIMKDFVFIDEENRGFFIMRDISSPVLDEKLYDGVSVYIKPEFRKTRLLKDMYEFMFKNFDGDIIGYTDINSEHNKVLTKRHQALGILYKLNRKDYT